MTKPRYHPPRCKVCGKTRAQAGHISATGLCRDHSLERYEANYDAMQHKTGPYGRWWAAKLAVGVGWYPFDELPPKP